jgi:uridylate kinase
VSDSDGRGTTPAGGGTAAAATNGEGAGNAAPSGAGAATGAAAGAAAAPLIADPVAADRDGGPSAASDGGPSAASDGGGAPEHAGWDVELDGGQDGDGELPAPRWRRIVLKLSGEAFASNGAHIDRATVERIAEQVVDVRRSLGVDIAVVVGGGNIWRGQQDGAGMDAAQADYMGMLATVINALALQDALERAKQPTRVMTAVKMEQVAEPYIRRRAIRHLEKGRVVILAAGTGNPFFTTDTTAALRAAEIEAEAILKGTHSGVDGVYTADPKRHPEATRFDQVTYMDVLNRGLRVMDSTAITFCMDRDLPIVVFDLMRDGNIRSILEGRPVGTLVR